LFLDRRHNGQHLIHHLPTLFLSLVRVRAWGYKLAIEFYCCGELTAMDEACANKIVDHGY
jgi:hypothetical protein